MPTRILLLAIGGVVALGLVAFAGYQFWEQQTALRDTRATLAETETRAQTLEQNLKNTELERETVSAALQREQEKNTAFETKLENLSGDVGTLKKLAKTDPELLAKYSKVYFLNENYAPPALKPIDDAYWYPKDRELELHAEVAPHMNDLLDDAKDEDIDLLVTSAYRSFATQAGLKASYRVTYGSGANAFSADQGYSEHQLGTTVDFTTSSVGSTFVGFDKTPAYAWLLKHAWRYGFVLSYPKENTYYQYEPWHWRYVGRDLAERLSDEEQWFYNLDQRTIDTYLVTLFD